MRKVVDIFKNMFLDLYSMAKGFIYGFVMVGLFFILGAALIYVVLLLKNLLF